MFAASERTGRTRRLWMFKAVAVLSAGLSLTLCVNEALAQDPAAAVQPVTMGDTVRNAEIAPVAETSPAARKKLTLFTAIDFGRIEAGNDLRENGFQGYDAE